MAIAISPSAAASLTSGFSYPAQEQIALDSRQPVLD
jgi:hypothetical protein